MSQPRHKLQKSFLPSFKKENFNKFFTLHLQAAINGINQLSRTPVTTLITCLVIGIALALPTALIVLLKNVEVLSKNYQQSTQMTLFLKQNISDNDAQKVLENIKLNKAIVEAHAISPAQGLQELQQQAGLESVMPDLSNNPLPWAIVVLPNASYHSPEDLTQLSNTLKQNPAIDSIQLDILWAQRLNAFITLAHRFIYALTIFLAIAVVLIINNCIRSVTQTNKKEINVIKFMGGTDVFIRRPFLYSGVIYSFLGSIIAWQLVDLLLLWLRGPTNTLAGLYQSEFQLAGIGFLDTLLLLISGIGLGLTGAWFAVSRYLKAPAV